MTGQNVAGTRSKGSKMLAKLSPARVPDSQVQSMQQLPSLPEVAQENYGVAAPAPAASGAGANSRGSRIFLRRSGASAIPRGRLAGSLQVRLLLFTPVLLFSKLSNIIPGYFDPDKYFFR